MKDKVFKQVTLGEAVELDIIRPMEEAALRDLKILLTDAHKTRASIMEDIQKEAEALQEKSSQEARALVEKAYKRADAIELEIRTELVPLQEEAQKKGYDEGYEAGLSQGYEAAAVETMELLQVAQALLENAKRIEGQRLEQVEAKAVHLMSLILKEASAAVWQRIPQHILVEAWKQAIHMHALKGDMTLLIHPVQLQLIEALGEEAVELVRTLPNTTIKTDVHLPTDAMYLMNDDVNLNLSLSSVLQALCEELLTSSTVSTF
ncbi:MAG: hypothetical protein HEQ32_00890 [Vampirovibrio sp.]